MRLRRLCKLGGGVALMLTLAGCMDVDVAVKVKNASEAEAIVTQTISAQFYPTLKAGAGSGSGEEFCTRLGGGTLTENADGSATCRLAKSGGFASFSFDSGAEIIDFKTPEPGLVRVSIPARELTQGVQKAAGKSGNPMLPAEDANAQGAAADLKQEMLTYFTGHFLTLDIGGGTITDTNMTRAADGRSASEKIPFVDLIGGTARLPDEIYAVVRLD